MKTIYQTEREKFEKRELSRIAERDRMHNKMKEDVKAGLQKVLV